MVTWTNFWGGLAECAASGGEKKRGVQKANETGILEEALDMNLKKHNWQELGSPDPARPVHLRWAAERSAHSAVPTYMLKGWQAGWSGKSLKNCFFLVSQTIKNRDFAESWDCLWGAWGHLGQAWCVLGSLWACIGCVLARLRASWRRLGPILGHLWEILEEFWVVLGAFWQSFVSIFRRFSAILRNMRNRKKLRRTYGFSLIFKVPEEF